MVRQFNISQVNYFKTLLSYDPDTGHFHWLEKRRKHGGFIQVGDIAGTEKDGYVQIGIDGKQYRAHILAWWFMTGEAIPKGFEPDHRNRRRNDNRWSNIRLVTRTRNNHNSDPSSANKSGVKGVSFDASRGRWLARIIVNKVRYDLGRFDEFAEAVTARRDAEMRILGENAASAALLSASHVPEPKPHTSLDRDEFRRNRSLKIRKTNTSGYPGVRMHKKSGLWHARIVVRGKELSLGYFKIFEDAVSARKRAESEHHGQERK
ncbi:HNH endonuclease [Rhizobium sp. No.120]